MAAKKGKPGAVYIAESPVDHGEVILELTETLGALHPEGLAGLRKRHGPTFLYMANAEHRGESPWWYENAPREWRKRADALFTETVTALQRAAPKNHFFGPLQTDDGVVEWGYWEEEADEEEDLHAEVFHKGFRENPELRRIGGSPDDSTEIYEYRGRRIIIDTTRSGDRMVQIVRKAMQRGYDTDVVISEYVSTAPFPAVEAALTIDEWHEESKAKRRTKRKRIGLRTDAEREEAGGASARAVTSERRKKKSAFDRLREQTEEGKAGLGTGAPRVMRKIKLKAEGTIKYVGPKAGGALFKYGNATIELRAVGSEIEDEAIRLFPDMVSATVIGPDSTVLGMFATWGGERALLQARELISKKALTQNPQPGKPSRKETKARSFLRRMMNI